MLRMFNKTANLLLICSLGLSLAVGLPDKAVAEPFPIRMVTVDEVAGKGRQDALVRIPVVFDAEERFADLSYLRVLYEGRELVYQATDIKRDENGWIKGANLYVMDNFAPGESKLYQVAIADTPVTYDEEVAVSETDSDITVSGRDIGLTFYKDGTPYPGAIKAISSAHGEVMIGLPGSSGGNYAGPRASIKLEKVISKSLNDDFEEGDGTWPAGWHAVTLSGNPAFEWSGDAYKHGMKSVKITNGSESDRAVWESDKLPVPGGKRYHLEGWIQASGIVKPAGADHPGATIGFRFYDIHDQVVGEHYSGDATSNSWNHVYTSVVNAPQEAAYVSVFASLHGKGTAWFDLFSFVEGDLAASNFDNTANTQQNLSIRHETGPLFARVDIVNQLLRSQTPVNAYQTVTYMIPARGHYFDQIVEYSGDRVNPHEGVEFASLYVLQGAIYLGGNDQPGAVNDMIVSYDIAAGGQSLALNDRKKALVDEAANLALIPVSPTLDGIMDMDRSGQQLRIRGPMNNPVGVSRFYYHMYTQHRLMTTYVFHNGTSAAELNGKAIEYANPLVGIVDKVGASFDADIKPLLKQINDFAGQEHLRPDAWTMSALANYVNYDITGDISYKIRADQIVAANATAEMESVSYWESKIDNNQYNPWTLQGLPIIGMYYNPWDRLWKIADAVGVAHANRLGFTDDYGYFHLANTQGSLTNREAVANMELDNASIFLWGHKQAGNTEAFNRILNMLSNPVYQTYVNEYEIPYHSVMNGQYVAATDSFQPHYTALTTSIYKDIETISDQRLALATPNYRMLYNAIDIDTNNIGEDATGWPSHDRIQHHLWRWGFTNFYAYCMNLYWGQIGGVNPETGITSAAMILQRLVDTLHMPVSDQSGRGQFPLIIHPDFQYPFNVYGYYDSREYDPTTLVNTALALNKAYSRAKRGILFNGGFELGPMGANGWETHAWTGTPLLEWADDDKRSGSFSAKISGININGGFNKNWDNNVPVLPNREYTISLWMKTDNVAGGASDGAWFWYEQLDASRTVLDGGRWDSPKILGTNDWTLVEHTFTTLPEAASIRIYLHLRGSGSVWYDDVALYAK